MAGGPIPWVVFFSTLLMGGFGVVMHLSDEVWGLPWAAPRALGAAGSLAVQVRFSRRQSARVLGVTLLGLGALAALVGLNLQHTAHDGAAARLVLNGLLTVGAGAALSGFGFWRVKNPVPGITELVQVPQFYESDGVHFAVGWSERPLARGASFGVDVVAQNVTTAPRRLVIRLLGARPLAFESTAQVLELEPGVVVRASVPFRLAALAEGTLQFSVDVVGEGEQPGLRLRREEGADYVTDVAGVNLLGTVTLLTLGVGTFRWGGGHGVSLEVDTQAPLVTERQEPTVERLLVPSAADLDRAVRL